MLMTNVDDRRGQLEPWDPGPSGEIRAIDGGGRKTQTRGAAPMGPPLSANRSIFLLPAALSGRVVRGVRDDLVQSVAARAVRGSGVGAVVHATRLAGPCRCRLVVHQLEALAGVGP